MTRATLALLALAFDAGADPSLDAGKQAALIRISTSPEAQAVAAEQDTALACAYAEGSISTGRLQAVLGEAA